MMDGVVELGPSGILVAFLYWFRHANRGKDCDIARALLQAT